MGPPNSPSPHDYYLYHYEKGPLQAIRDRRWKLHFPHDYVTLHGRDGGQNGSPVPYDRASIELSLFDLKNDIGEASDVAAEYPEIVQRLQAAAEMP